MTNHMYDSGGLELACILTVVYVLLAIPPVDLLPVDLPVKREAAMISCIVIVNHIRSFLLPVQSKRFNKLGNRLLCHAALQGNDDVSMPPVNTMCDC
jgi:hypothetical protein